MALIVEVRINDRLIGVASAQNVSDLAGISDYAVQARSEPSALTGAGQRRHCFPILKHDRNQTAWALVAKMAAIITEAETAALTGDRDNG